MAYTESVVTFIDIMGFGTLVANEANFQKIDRILGRLRNVAQFEAFETKAHEQRSTCFSDCCVRSTPIIKSNGESNRFGILAHEVLDLVHTQLDLIGSESVLMRGAITIGPLIHEEDKVFGPALERAYRLETEAAQYPRIIIDPHIIRRARLTQDLGASHHDPDQDIAYLMDFLKRDRDGLYFINYLHLSSSESDGYEEQLFLIQKHKELIIAGATAHGERPSLAIKYNWLIEYHNQYVSGLHEGILSELCVRRDDYLIEYADFPFYQTLGAESEPIRGM